MSNTTVGVAGQLSPVDPAQDSFVAGIVGARVANRMYAANLNLTAAEAVALSTTAVHAAVTDTGVQQTVTTGFTAPPYPRNINATAGGTAGDIKAIAVTVFGTNEAGEAIQETLPAFTVDTAGTVQGNKAFKTVTSVVIPAHDNTGATTSIGFGNKIQLPHRLERNTVIAAYLNKVKEGTAPTVAVSSTLLENNTAILNSALNGTAVDIDYIV